MFGTRLGQLVVVGLLASSQRAQAQDQEPQQMRQVYGPATVRVETKKEGLTVASIVSRGSGVSSTGATVLVTTYQDRCLAPCEFTVAPGMHEIMTYGKFTRRVSKKFMLEQGEELVLEAKPRSAALPWVGYLAMGAGLGFATFGTIWATQDCSEWNGMPDLKEKCHAETDSAPMVLGAGAGLTVGGGVLLFGLPSRLKKMK